MFFYEELYNVLSSISIPENEVVIILGILMLE